MANNIRLSASRISTLRQCGLIFYYENILFLPSSPHKKTLTGSLVHAIAEYLRLPKWKHLYNEIDCGSHIDYKKSKTLTRFVDLFQQKHDIPFDLLEDLNGMLTVMFKHFDFWQKDAKKVFPPEYEFIFKVGDFELKGIIDALAEYEKNGEITYNIIDWKSKGKLFSKAEIAGENIQSAVYQLFIWKKFGKKSKVQFVMLRFPPNKLKPQRFIQEVAEKTEDQLMGVELYLIEMGKFFQQFSYQDALNGMCKDKGFCEYVCAYKKSFSYLQVRDKDNKFVKNYLMLDVDKITLKPGEKVVVMEHKGCPKYN